MKNLIEKEEWSLREEFISIALSIFTLSFFDYRKWKKKKEVENNRVEIRKHIHQFKNEFISLKKEFNTSISKIQNSDSIDEFTMAYKVILKSFENKLDAIKDR